MAREKRLPETPEVWPTSKCQRALRPLKLKIAALDRSLSASHSVADGLTAWSAGLAQRRVKQDCTSDDSAAYRPPSQKVRKYGVKNKDRTDATGSIEESMTADTVLKTVRTNFSGAVSSAYVGVYYAFTAILEKTRLRRKFPSLASRAAYTVGRCVHLTSGAFTDEAVDSETWYEAVPTHCRAAIVIGHATQLVLSSAKNLQPILPAFALALRGSPLASDIMAAILESTELTELRKTDTQELQTLATRINMPWALKIHFTREFRLEFMAHASFTVLLDLKSTNKMDDSTQALCLKAATTTLQCLKRRKELKTESDLRLYDVLQAIAFRVFHDPDAWVLSLLQEAFSRAANNALLEQLMLALSLATLLHGGDDAAMVEHVRSLSSKILTGKSTEKQECLVYIINAFPSDMLVKVVECLVGKADDLAIALANMAATTFEDDFVEWSDNIESAVLRHGKNEAYRFEPLLGSWIAKTPAIPRSKRGVPEDLGSETEEDDEGTDGYDADHSRLQFIFTQDDCDDEDDLVKDFAKSAHKIPADVLNLLSIGKKSDVMASAKLLKRINRSSEDDTEDNSPLQSKRPGQSDTALLSTLQSPTPARGLTRGRNSENYVAPDELLRFAKHTGTKRSRTTQVVKPYKSSAASPTRVSTRVQRELDNLKSGFLRKRQSAQFVPIGPRRRTSRQVTHVDTSDEDEDDDELSVEVHAKSDVDELSLL